MITWLRGHFAENSTSDEMTYRRNRREMPVPPRTRVPMADSG
jgi:hypothetical protein